MANSNSASPQRIFLSYRRDDSAYAVHAVETELSDRYGDNAIIFDVATTHAGDFRERLSREIDSSEVMLVFIGNRWLELLDQRSDASNDFVQYEIAKALKIGVEIIPVLVGNAEMPKEHDLPRDIRPLAYRQAKGFRAGENYKRDMEDLLLLVDRELGRILYERQQEERRRIQQVERAEAERRQEIKRQKTIAAKNLFWWQRVPWRDKLDMGEGKSAFVVFFWSVIGGVLIYVSYLLGDQFQIRQSPGSAFYKSASGLGSFAGYAVALFGLANMRRKRRSPPGLEIALTAVAAALLTLFFASMITDGSAQDTAITYIAAASAGLFALLAAIRWKSLSGAEVAMYWFSAVSFCFVVIVIQFTDELYAAACASLGTLGAMYLWIQRTRRSTAEIAIYTIGFLFLSIVLAVLAINWTKSF